MTRLCRLKRVKALGFKMKTSKIIRYNVLSVLALVVMTSCNAPSAEQIDNVAVVSTPSETVRQDQDQDQDGASNAPEQAISDRPYHFPELEGWRSEIVALPLGFAPQMSVKGHQDLRFSGGMFTAGAPDYWSYSFLWWLDGDQPLSPETLASDFEAYLTGLAGIVDRGGDKAAHKTKMTFSQSLDEVDLIGGFTAQAVVFDGFVAKDQITLNMKGAIKPCKSLGKKAVIFTASPQDMNAPVWQELERIRAAFKCVAG